MLTGALEITVELEELASLAYGVPGLMDEVREHVVQALAYYPYLPQGFRVTGVRVPEPS